MKILVACEYSGIVRNAFAEKGHDAVSCDLLSSESSGKHFKGDLWDIAYNYDWDLVIAHPPCTHLAVSGNRWYAGTKEREDAVKFVERIWYLKVDKLCIENPVGVLSTKSKLPKPYYIQPWQFGHGETKKTGLWTRGLPQLQPTNIVEGRADRIHKMPPSKDRSKLRSLTYQGIADAMAQQWG